MKQLMLILALFVLALPALAADATGKWSASVPGPQGNFTLTFNLKAEGETLTGTTGNDFTGDVPIANGKIAGDTITFDVTFDFGGNAATFHYKGEVAADAIEFTRTATGDGPWAGERKLTAKRM